jgi:hypothetical protein
LSLPRCAAIAAAFPKVIKPVEGEPLVIQYEVKLETPHNCGGMYVATILLLAMCYLQTRSS